MINIKELRVGNYVWEDYGGEYKVVGLTSVGNHIDLCKVGMVAVGRYLPDVLYGIPLNEKYLHSFGFIKTIGEGDEFDYWSHSETGELIWEHDEGFCHDFCYGGNIEYVHQLQNLFFILTGKELETNREIKEQ